MNIGADHIQDVSGSFDTENDPIVCVGNKKYGKVSLCFKAGIYVPFAVIKLYSRNLAKDADATYDDALALGKEIERRWNSPLLKEEEVNRDG